MGGKMKRSEMIYHIKYYLYGNSQYSEHNDMAEGLLNEIERQGMLPPTIQGVYDTVPTVTPTGNLDYGWKRGWENE